MNIRLFALIWITTFILGLRILQVIRERTAAKEAKKVLDAAKDAAMEKRREEDARKSAAEMEKLSAEIKLALANRIASMNEEQLAAFTKALDEPKKEYVPFYLPAYFYNPLSMVPYYGPRWWANP